MTYIASNKFLKKITAIYMVVAVLFASFPISAFADGLTVDLRANGSNSLTLSDASQPFTITLSSANATSCLMTSPVNSSVNTSASMDIAPGHPYYPAVGGSTTFTVDCTDSVGSTVSDSVTVSLEVAPPSVIETPAPTADIKANGSDGPVNLNSGDTYTYSWNSTNATSCQQTSPINSGISIAGESGTISAGHPFYPAVGGSVTLTITCTNGTTSATDSVVINLNTNNGGGNTVSVDVLANGSNGPVILNSGGTFTYSWNSTNASACTMTSPINSGISIAGESGTISAGHPFYPSVNQSTLITINCTNQSGGSASDSVEVRLQSTQVPSQVTADIKANGSDGPVNLNSGDTYTYSWNSTNATSCQQTSPINSGISIAGESGTISAGHPFYPAVGGSVTLTITCTNGTTSATDSVVINLNTNNGGGNVTVDIKANGSDGPLTINQGSTYVYNWNSTNATSCQQTSPVNSGVSIAGESGTISAGHPFYPGVNAPVTLTITCTNGSSSATDSVVINLQAVNNPAVTADIKANGSDGPVVINSGDAYIYTWNSTNATSCEMTSPINSGISLAGTSASIVPGHPFYPAVGGSVTLTINCINSTSSATDSVVVSINPSCPVPQLTSPLTASVNEDATFSYTITTNPSDANVVVSNLPEGLSYSTSSKVISGTISDPNTYNVTISVENGCGSITKTLAITVNDVSDGGGGGGGGDDDDDDNDGGSSSGGRRRGGGGGTVRGEEFECLWIKDYMRRDFDNDPIQVMRLQAFLLSMGGYTGVTVNGVFDQATYDAVSAFQMQYKGDILTPWGHTGPTGYVYILTLKKVNEIYCQKVFPLNEAQVNEIAAFRALLEGLRAQGYNVDGYYPNTGSVTSPSDNDPDDSDTGTTTIPIVGKEIHKGQNLKNLAGAIFTLPHSWMEGLQCLYEFILILIVLYVIANVLEDALAKNGDANTEKKFRNKWATIVGGLILAIILSYVFDEWCLILPLIVALILSIVWVVIRPNHSSIKASFKSWYLVLMARSKSMANNAKNSAKSNMDKISDKKDEIKESVQKEEPKEVVKVEEKKEETETKI